MLPPLSYHAGNTALECTYSGTSASTFTSFRVLDYAPVEIRESLPTLCRDQRIIEVITVVELPKNKATKLWAIGSFWFFALSIVTAVILLIIKQGGGLLTTILVIVAIEVILTIIGVFTLRSTGDLSEEGFIELMSLAFKAQFQFIKLFKGADDTEPNQKNKSVP